MFRFLRRWRTRTQTPIDRTGAATVYPNRSGALSNRAVSKLEARHNAHTTVYVPRAPLMTRGQEHRSRRASWPTN
ncbi:hypothetical protein GA0070615_2295 [Micromonospora aurantiaca]|nr:hypothetical protein GA0070615_2295 [Micromonospora aurantiaca]